MRGDNYNMKITIKLESEFGDLEKELSVEDLIVLMDSSALFMVMYPDSRVRSPDLDRINNKQIANTYNIIFDMLEQAKKNEKRINAHIRKLENEVTNLVTKAEYLKFTKSDKDEYLKVSLEAGKVALQVAELYKGKNVNNYIAYIISAISSYTGGGDISKATEIRQSIDNSHASLIDDILSKNKIIK